MRGKSLARADRRLLQVIDEAMTEAARRAGSHLACRPGCTGCCHGPFPINGLDAARLHRGLEELAARDPERAAALVERARALLPFSLRISRGTPPPGSWRMTTRPMPTSSATPPSPARLSIQ